MSAAQTQGPEVESSAPTEERSTGQLCSYRVSMWRRRGDWWFPGACLPVGLDELMRDTNKKWVGSDLGRYLSADHRATYVHVGVHTTHLRNQEFAGPCSG